MSEQPRLPGEVPVMELPELPPEELARWLAFHERMAAWGRRRGVEPVAVFGAVQVCQKLMQAAADPAAVAAWAALLPAWIDRSDPVRAAVYFLNVEINGLDRATVDRMHAMVAAAGEPPVA
jgi:hypothetical protein